jgi:hypothetical protein
VFSVRVPRTLQQTIGASGVALDFFGHALSVRGDVLLVVLQCRIGSNLDRGAAYRFERSLGTE